MWQNIHVSSWFTKGKQKSGKISMPVNGSQKKQKKWQNHPRQLMVRREKQKMNSDDARKSNGEGLSVSAGEKSESGFVKIHLTKNGFYADPKDIINHPNAKKQLAQARAWLKEQKKG